jgi:hypothetical protein
MPPHLIPADKPLKILIGGTYAATISLFTDRSKTAALDLTGYVVTLVADNGVALREGKGFTLERAAGKIKVELSAEETSTLAPTQAHYVVQLELPGVPPEVFFPLAGTMTVEKP